MKAIAYLAHPVSAPDRAGIDANLVNARAWLRWLIDNTSWAISAPWMPYVEIPAEDSYRARGLADDLAMLARGHDIIVLTGGRISQGMALELAKAKERGLVVVDLTRMGASPPPAIASDQRGHADHMRHHLLEDLCAVERLNECKARGDDGLVWIDEDAYHLARATAAGRDLTQETRRG